MRVVYPPTIDWDWMVQRPQHILKRLAARGFDVFYCNATQRPWLPPERVSPHLTLVHDFKTFLRDLPADDETIFWVSWPGHWQVIRNLRSAASHGPVVIYDAVDDFLEWRRYDSVMVAISDAIVASSMPLYERYVGSGKPVTLIRNGADFELFNQATRGLMPMPKDMASIKGPVVGFVGALGPWVDVGMLTALGEEGLRQGWTVVLVGPPFGAPLPRKTPLISLGMKPYLELPCYIARFDVCILPFSLSPTAMASNPIKLYDYLAAGKPVVATPIPEASNLRHLIHVASDTLEFVELVRRALERPDEGKEQRVAFAKANSWEVRIDQVEQVIRSSSMAKSPRIY